MAARALMAYSGGLLAFILVKVLAPGYFARQDTRTPVRIGIIAMSANMVLNVVLVFPLAHAGLALATTLSASLNAALLWRGLRRDGVYVPAPGWPRFLLRVIGATAAMSGLLVWWSAPLASWSAWDVAERGTALAAVIAVGILAYFLSLAILGLRPRHMVLREGGV
jgi:putative peptidoglycan lipid II flippase